MLRLIRKVFGVEEPRNFIEIPLKARGHLYVSPMPFGPYDKYNEIIHSYKAYRVQHVVALVTDEELEKKAKKNILEIYERLGIRATRLPFKDLLSPVYDDVAQVMPYLISLLVDHKKRVAVHCNAGVGRTGLIAACMVASINKISGEDAIKYVKSQMLTDITDEQKRFVVKWGAEFAPKVEEIRRQNIATPPDEAAMQAA